MRWCLNQITAGRQAPADEAALGRLLEAVRAGGWEAIELWLPHWDAVLAASAPSASRLLAESGLAAAGACAQGGALFFGEGAELETAREALRRRLEHCATLGAPHLVVVPGGLARAPTADDFARASDNLTAAASEAAAYGVRLGIEFLRSARLVNNLSTALQLAGATGAENVGVVLDSFHYFGGPSKAEDLDLLAQAPHKLFFVHVNDGPSATPRELWTEGDRRLPGEGAFPLRGLVGALKGMGYDGAVSLELFDDAFALEWAGEAASASRRAYASGGEVL